MFTTNELLSSLQTGFIDKSIQSNQAFTPQILVNDKKAGKKILATIISELLTCDAYWLSVAFVTTSGVAALINTLLELENKEVKGTIIVSQYLNFTQPTALRRLLNFKHIDLRIIEDAAFHSKGFLFKHGEHYNLIIGSTNLTAAALSTNIELNLKVSATATSKVIFNAIAEFTNEYEKAIPVTHEFIASYEELYIAKSKHTQLLSEEFESIKKTSILPNAMQEEALHNLASLRKKGNNKALLISATGTGKTFLSAFDVNKFKPRTFLFVVHRRTIAEEALKSFRLIIDSNISMGLYSGEKKEIDKDFIFSTVQTISKQENLVQFPKDHFDYIVIDETHRAGADSYKRIFNYFKPKFLLGMTATPERTDGEDIFSLFSYNIAYEIRLHRALSENMLCPFHYYGVTDISINNEVVDDLTDFNKLTSKERVNRIIENAELYGCDDGEVRGLIFCSRNEIANKLSEELNKRKKGDSRFYRTLSLTGSTSERDRQDAMSRLESENEADKLDYIFTVDIFNEGIDIPRVNQIIMLRPTNSAIIFVQQLGRGLRKNKAKHYLTVIDFIGNYNNNYLVPIALYGDQSYNKDNIRKLMAGGSSLIPGDSTINFDRIAKEKIFASINQSNLSRSVDLKNDYLNLKYKLGRIPMMVDFLEYGSRDPWSFAKYKKSYYNYVRYVENEVSFSLNNLQIELLELFALEINNSKRIEECLILKMIIDKGNVPIKDLKLFLLDIYSMELSEETLESCLRNLNFQFIRQDKSIIKKEQGILLADKDLRKALTNETFKNYLADNTNYSISTFNKIYKPEKYTNGFIKQEKYGRKDVCRILNWPTDLTSTLFGYRTNLDTTPCFVTYHKAENIEDNTKYNDHFIDQHTFAWESRSQRKIESGEIQKVISSKRILLFIKKEDGEGSDFYYIGDVKIIENSVEQKSMPVTGSPVVHFKFELDQPISDDLYQYLID